MLENSRKSSKEGHLFDFKRLIEKDDAVTRVMEFLDANYCHNRVLLLKMWRAVLLMLVIFAFFLFFSGYYVSIRIIPSAINIAKNNGLGIDNLNTIESAFQSVPDIYYFLALIIGIIVIVSLAIISFINDLPHQMLNILNPTRIEAKAKDEKQG
jgi:hypothetical protein